MVGIYEGYNVIDTKSKTTYFAGANTGDGFVGSYVDIANESLLDKVYIIKGGPGTGKSSLMRRVAKTAERENHEVGYYLCGSDPESLDCIVIDGKIAVLDGTSPHTRDMQFPGAKSTIIDISKCWDENSLELECGKIMVYSARKALEYSSAYKYLKAAEQIEHDNMLITSKFFNYKKAEACIERLIKKLGKPTAKNTDAKHYYTHGITMKGQFCLDTLQRKADVVYSITDALLSAPHFMSLLYDKLSLAGYSLIVGHIPLCNYISEIYVKDADACFAVSLNKSGERNINIGRFVDRDAAHSSKSKLKLASKCREECINASLESLKLASNYHFALEEIYKGAMDFSKLNDLTDNTEADIMCRLK